MNTVHLNEMQLQLYADDGEGMDPDLKEHVTGCLHCQVMLENYRLISSSIKDMPVPAFDFDLAGEVMASITIKKTPVNWIPLLAAITGVLLVVLMTCGYARQAIALFSAVPEVWGYVLTVPVLALMLVQLIFSLTEYKRRMNMLPDK